MSDLLDFVPEEDRMWVAVDSASAHAANVAAMDVVLDGDRPVEFDDEHDREQP